MKTTSLAALSLIAAVMVPVASAQVTFDFNGGPEGMTTYAETQSGITMTMSNAIDYSAASAPFTGGTLFLAFSDQANSWGSLYAPIHTFTLQFDQAVLLSSYTVGGITSDATGATFSVTSGAGSSVGNDISAAGGPFSFTGGYVLPANQVATWTYSVPMGAGYFTELTVTAVPEPATVAGLMGVAVLGTAAILRRRRNRAARS